MKFTIKHESRGRMRVHMEQYRMTYEQADTLLYVIHNHRNVTFVKVYDRTADTVYTMVVTQQSHRKNFSTFFIFCEKNPSELFVP